MSVITWNLFRSISADNMDMKNGCPLAMGTAVIIIIRIKDLI